MRHIPRSSRIFIGVLAITMLVTYIALHFATYVADQTLLNSPEIKYKDKTQDVEVEPEQPKLSTEDWKSYKDKTYPISFLYPKTWTVKSSTNKLGFYDIVLNPGAKFYDMHVYVSDKSYYGLEGLKENHVKIGDRDGIKASDNLFGVKAGETYYTFDGTMNTTQSAELTTLLDTVKFE